MISKNFVWSSENRNYYTNELQLLVCENIVITESKSVQLDKPPAESMPRALSLQC